MTHDRSLSSALSSCLDEPYPSSQKGGTLIAAEVQDLATHQARLCDPDGYRPPNCPRCGARVHVHEFRSRRVHNDEVAEVVIKVFRCADRAECRAVWRVLPGFLARWLQRCWRVIEEALEHPASSPVPERTSRRWRARLASSARRVVAAMAMTAGTAWSALAVTVGLEGRRADLVMAYRKRWTPGPGWCLAELAETIHRLCPGLRLV